MKPKTYLPIISILALFTLITFLPLSPVTPAETAGVEIVPCSVGAYVISDNPAGVKVRSGPGEENAVIATLPIDPEVEVILYINGVAGEWFRITELYIYGDSKGETQTPDLVGWVTGPVLGLRAIRYGTTGAVVPLYEKPDTKSPVLTRLQSDAEVVVVGCRGDWVKVNYKGIEGWLAPESQCGNPFTSCS
jgi:SH3-like domain-containing protein